MTSQIKIILKRKDDAENLTNLFTLVSVMLKRIIYLCFLKKRIRKLVTFHVHTLRVGKRILVDRVQLEDLLHDEDREYLK